ncbi:MULTISPECIES: hypothetical protein [Shewanella]|uniref:hypothetical protein n=1 Tax=Shewanella TaxID=22 RepID=UPI000D3739BF|nr:MULTISPECIES: hypothetical protein [Shewanella]MCU8028536.1 hypothetical protein [Shewanella sp. SM73]
MELSTFSDLQVALDHFNNDYPRPHGKVELTDLLDISVEKNATWPSNESPGVYIFLNREKKLTYIGKASFGNCIGARLNSRFYTTWVPKKSESEGCVYITTIPLPREFAFEAPAIEEYLLGALRTRSNHIGSR